MNIHEHQARQLLSDHGIPGKPDFRGSFKTNQG